MMVSVCQCSRKAALLSTPSGRRPRKCSNYRRSHPSRRRSRHSLCNLGNHRSLCRRSLCRRRNLGNHRSRIRALAERHL